MPKSLHFEAMDSKGIFIGATGQNVGKTTICLGMISGLKKNFPRLGFIKPVGQQHIKVKKNLLVDKDVVLFKETFNLPFPYQKMSPVIFAENFTREYLDGKIDIKKLENTILDSYRSIYEKSDFTVVEGTGHLGVGSIANLNNVKIASMLGLNIILIATGGIGSTFDEISLAKTLCDSQNVKIKGVILNRVFPKKKEMIVEYISKALARWDCPLIGCIPYSRFLSTPSMEDFEILFKSPMIAGEKYHFSHFENIRLVATSLETFKEVCYPGQLLVTPATREDILLAVIEMHLQHPPKTKMDLPEYGLILTGHHPPSLQMIKNLKLADVPAIYAPTSTYDVMKMIASFTAKIRKEDVSKVKKACEIVESHLDFSYFL